jgi:replicative DNA helicase
MPEQQLPCDVAAERLVLGSVILNHVQHAEVFQLLTADDFSLDSHRKIYATMRAMDADGETIDRITVASKLNDLKLLESIGGFTKLADLDTGLPDIPNIESYIEILREKSALRKIIYAAQNLMNRCLSGVPDSKDLIAQADESLMKIGYQPNDAAELLKSGEVVQTEGGMDRFLNPEIGVRTPWELFTEKTGGYRRGELFIIAGNPSMGKSAAALQVAMQVAKDGLGVMYFSLEMSRASLVRRMICYRARVDSAKLRAGFVNQDERARLRNAINEASAWPLWIAEHGISTVSGIRAAFRKLRVKEDVFMIVIDYLQLLQSIGNHSNRNAEVSEITRQLKLLAVDEKVNVQLLSQLNRDNMKERRAPELRDLRESGSIEQDADACAFVWRPEQLWRDREDLRGVAEIILAKQRNGPTGKIELTWLGSLTAFESRAEGFREE